MMNEGHAADLGQASRAAKFPLGEARLPERAPPPSLSPPERVRGPAQCWLLLSRQLVWWVHMFLFRA